MVSFLMFSQKDKSKSVKLKGTDYKIELPKKYKLRTQKGVDFLFYSIKKKSKKDNDGEMGIYLGFYPNKISNVSYKKVDSLNIKILNTKAKFLIYRFENKYLIEGITPEKVGDIETNEYLEKKLQFHIYGIAKNRNELRKMEKIFSSIK